MKRNLLAVLFIISGASFVSGQPVLSDYLALVIEFTESGQNLEAKKLCDNLASAYPGNADVFFLRGINHYVLKEYRKAIDDFDRTLELRPEYPDVYLYRARARKAEKDYLGALQDYNRAKDHNLAQTLTSLAGDAIRAIFSDRGN